MFFNNTRIKITCILLVSMFKTCQSDGDILPTKIMFDFVKSVNSGQSIFFACPKNAYELQKIFKEINNFGVRTMVYNIQKPLDVGLIPKTMKLALILDGNCNNIDEFLNQSASEELFFEKNYWLIIGNKSSVEEKFYNVSLAVNANIWYIDSANTLNDDNISVFDMYNPSLMHGGTLKFIRVGTYKNNAGFQIKKHSKYYLRRDLSEMNLTTAIVVPKGNWSNWQEYVNAEYGDSNRAKQNINVFQNCKDLYNYSQKIIPTPSWGYRNDKGEVGPGLLRALDDHEADFGTSLLRIYPYRMKFARFGAAVWTFRGTFLFRHPKGLVSSHEIYLRPLDSSVWLCTLGFVVFCVVFIKLLFYFNDKIVFYTEDTEDTTWGFLILYALGEFCQQGSAYVSLVASGRIVNTMLLLLSFMVYQFYSGNILSILLSEPAKTINTLEDLLKSPLKVRCENSLFDLNYWNKTTDPIDRQLFEKKMSKEKDSGFLPSAQGFQRLQEGGYAFHCSAAAAYVYIKKKFTDSQICDLTEIQLYPPFHIHVNVPNGSPLREIFNYCVILHREVGVLNYLRKLWYPDTPQCQQKSEEEKEITAGYTETSWPIAILGAGYLISLVVLVIEEFVSRYGDKIPYELLKNILFQLK